ncbi:unnamed protein product [Staurois parvus]|uniref:Uncharacterized protein n=1 Tax=Staurois parvus TaxID=386267 RepID=A0ABN9CLQ7_9NEOB|nr:unnamed protein product [Staurois parvus]
MGTDMWHWHKALMDSDRWHFWGHTDHQCPDDHCQHDSSRGEKCR